MGSFHLYLPSLAVVDNGWLVERIKEVEGEEGWDHMNVRRTEKGEEILMSASHSICNRCHRGRCTDRDDAIKYINTGCLERLMHVMYRYPTSDL